jgi:hypothetical protein
MIFSKRLIVGCGALAVVAGAAVLADVFSATNADTPDASVSAELVQSAVVARQDVIIPKSYSFAQLGVDKAAFPAAVGPKLGASSPIKIAASAVEHPSVDALSATDASGVAKLKKIFTGPALEQESLNLQHGLNAQKEPTFVALGGGAGDLTVTSSKAQDDGSLEIQGTIDTWSLIGQIQGDKVVLARPENATVVKATVVTTADGPRVVAFSEDFAPGSET